MGGGGGNLFFAEQSTKIAKKNSVYFILLDTSFYVLEVFECFLQFLRGFSICAVV